MKVIKAKDYDQLSKIAADIIAAQVIVKPDCVLGLATGSSPIGIYEYLVKKYENGELDFGETVSVNLDEYVGLGGDHGQSYRYFMQEHLFDHVNIKPENTFVPNGCADDLNAECREYDARIRRLGGIDLQLLGIGFDGHIGFNEPDDFFIGETHVADLLPSTVEANSRFFESVDAVPKQAISMGMGSIMQARKILLIANGKKKAEVIERAINGKITPQLPASLLQLHGDVTVVYSEE